MDQAYITKSPGETKKIGKRLALEIMSCGAGPAASVVFLRGELGAGKTQFAQGMALGLGIASRVNSPTFPILKKYPVPLSGKERGDAGFSAFYHIDCYRLKDAEELSSLGWEKIAADPGNLIVVEWPDIAADLLSRDPILINFEHLGARTRRLTVKKNAR